MASEDILRVVNDVIKPEKDKRVYRALQLKNRMKVLLISDPTTDKSAAALDVHVGHMCDPRELPGLAHFCEHMLFLGTEKYPSENEYNKFLNEHGGGANAFTAADHTKYFFDVTPENLPGALDRFAQFFLHPLFTECATEREVNAVNSEHEQNIKNDVWRLDQLLRSSSKPDHAFCKFNTGNKDTLDTIPKSKGITTRDELLKFHSQWYSANVMAISVLGKESLDELQNMIVNLFSNVIDNNVDIPEWTEHPLGPNEAKKMVHVVPVMDIRKLDVIFPIPDLGPFYKTDPGNYLAHLIGHEGPGSILSTLKAKGWVNNLCAGKYDGAKGFAFFNITTDLTEKGIENVDDIVTLMFEYLQMLKNAGPQEWIFRECQHLSSTAFRFKDKESPGVCACSTASYLHDYPLKEVISGPYLMDEYRPELIEMLLSKLTPDAIKVAVVGKKFEGQTDAIEPWYGTHYSIKPIAEHIIQKWSDVSTNENLHLPPTNEFIPTNLDLTPREKEASTWPMIIKNTSLTRIWFKQDQDFLLPKAMLNFQLISPLTNLDPLHCNFTHMFVNLFHDALNEYTYAAALAGQIYSLNTDEYGIFLYVNGYSDKQNIILEKIMEKLTNFKVDPKRFEILKEEFVRELRNFKSEQPYYHASYHMGLLLSENVWTIDEQLAVIDELDVEGLQAFIPKLLSRFHIESLIHGNVTKQQAFELVSIVENALQKHANTKPLLPSQLLRNREIKLPTGCNFLMKGENTVHANSCTQVYYQCGIKETCANVSIQLVRQLIEEPCFDTLRTKEQLGYSVWSDVWAGSAMQGLTVTVQSDRNPEYVDVRIEAFLHSMESYLTEILEEEFEKHKNALIAIRLEKPKQLFTQNCTYWCEITSQQYNFDRDNVEVAVLRTLSKDDAVDYFKKLFSLNAPKRRKLAVHIFNPNSSKMQNEVKGSCLNGFSPVSPIREPTLIEDVIEFKNAMSLFPLISPYVPVSSFLAEAKPKL